MNVNGKSHGPGRPCVKIDINFHDPLKSIDQIKSICKNNKVKENVHEFAKALLNSTEIKESNSTQTDMDGIDYFNDVLENTSGDDLSYLMSTLWMQFEQDTKLKLMMMFYSDLSFNEQSDLFAFLGHSLNKDMYAASTKNDKKSFDLNFDDLKAANKSSFYESCDRRLKAFIDNLTEKTSYVNENLNFKSNAYENILKARNGKFIPEAGIKEHMVTYLASGKSRHASQKNSKQPMKYIKTSNNKYNKLGLSRAKFSSSWG